MEDKITLFEVLTLLAIIAGPMLGVWIGGKLQTYRERARRRADIFYTLMRTRSHRIAYEHVVALNAVETEYYSDTSIIESWKEYIDTLTPLPESSSDLDHRNNADNRNKKFVKLLSKLGKKVGIKIDEIDTLESNYMPQGWIDNENEERYLRQVLISMLSRGHFPVQIKDSASNPPNLFPPKPE